MKYKKSDQSSDVLSKVMYGSWEECLRLGGVLRLGGAFDVGKVCEVGRSV